MATPQAVLAIIRAVRPAFRNKCDRLAFAVNALLLADGFKLVAVGKEAENLQTVEPDAAEVGTDGWLDLKDSYAFAYTDAQGKRKPVLIRAVPMDDKLLVHVLRPGTDKSPQSVELDVNSYTTDSSDPVEGYKDLGDMVSCLERAVHHSSADEALPAASQAPLPGMAADCSAPASTRTGEALRDGPPQGLRNLPTPGSEDILPPGIPRDITGIPGVGRGFEPPIGGMGVPGGGFPGGMHVGPNDPIFQGSSRSRPGFGLPQGPFPGVRYDPINPEGLEGFNASDFQRGRVHPDIMPPGRDRGPDFDSMFG